MTSLEDIPLREKKYAQTKLALLEAAIEQLKDKPLEDIAIKDLCKQAQVSDATFFNYFTRKADILVYFIQLWSIEVSWHARQATGENTGLGVIETIFAFTAKQSANHPTLTSEITAFQARMREAPPLGNISLAERLLAFPDLTELETLPAEGLDSILPVHIKRAIEAGELPADTDVDCVLLALVSIFFGVPLVMFRVAAQNIGAIYYQQLNLLWAGVRAGGCKLNNKE